MPTLIERMHELSVQIRLLADSQVTEGEAKRFATRADEFSDPSNAISIPARRFGLLMAKGVQMETSFLEVRVEARGLKRTIDNIAAKYDTDRRSILAPDTNWRLSTRSQLTRLAEHVNEHLLAAWRKYVLQLKPNVDQGLLRVLRSSPAYATHANYVEQLNTELYRLAERLPESQEEVDSPERLAEDLRRTLEDLPTDIPQPVRELFMAINQGTATAADLTDEAVEWLREKQLLHTLHVSWGAI